MFSKVKTGLFAPGFYRFNQHFQHQEGVIPSYIAFSFVLLGYPIGLAMLFSEYGLINVLGVFFVAEVLIISAYLLHEFSHRSIFKTPALNKRWGTVMTWINGSCYGGFDEIRHKHMRHHVDRADVISFDLRRFIVELPKPLNYLLKALEWAYIPAAEILMHTLVIVLPFVTPKWHHKRARLLWILLVRAAFFGLMAWISLKAWLLYMLAYGLMLTALRFADAYQHTYDVFVVLEGGKINDGKLRDPAYEEANTYSNLVSVGYPWLNLLLLNFSYHNAHHEKPVVPWYQLPSVHEKLYGKEAGPVLPMISLFKSFHKYRITRLESEDYGSLKFGPGGADHFIGAVGISFLITV